MIKLIIIAGLLFSHSIFAASKGRTSLKVLLSCDTAMRAGLSAERAGLFQQTKRLFEKYELMDTVIGGDFQARLKMREETMMAMIRSLVLRINDSRDTTPAARLDAEIKELEASIDGALTPVEKNLSGRIAFSAAGKRAMETRHFDEDWSDLGRAEPPKPQQQQQQQQMRPLNPGPPPNHGGWDIPGFRPDWPPREKP